jgi:hypothetical protein
VNTSSSSGTALIFTGRTASAKVAGFSKLGLTSALVVFFLEGAIEINLIKKQQKNERFNICFDGNNETSKKENY